MYIYIYISISLFRYYYIYLSIHLSIYLPIHLYLFIFVPSTSHIIGSMFGGVQSFRFPLTLPGDWLESRIHGDRVTEMKLSLDDGR